MSKVFFHSFFNLLLLLMLQLLGGWILSQFLEAQGGVHIQPLTLTYSLGAFFFFHFPIWVMGSRSVLVIILLLPHKLYLGYVSSPFGKQPFLRAHLCESVHDSPWMVFFKCHYTCAIPPTTAQPTGSASAALRICSAYVIRFSSFHSDYEKKAHGLQIMTFALFVKSFIKLAATNSDVFIKLW